MLSKRLIVNADDFGFSPGISAGIIRAHREGILTSTTIMANMPSAGKDVELLGQVPDLGTGVHLNACQGPAISDLGKSLLAGSDGIMRWDVVRLIVACITKSQLRQAVAAEFEAQIQWVLDRGIKITHLDSHRHLHAWPPIFARVTELAKRYNIRFIRKVVEKLPAASWPPSGMKQRYTRWLLNRMAGIGSGDYRDLLVAGGTWGIAHTGRIDAVFLKCVAGAVQPGVTEIMTHPGWADDVDVSLTRLVASRRTELEALCDESVKEAFKRNEIELTNYGCL